MVIIQFAFRSHFAVKTYLYLSFFKKAIIVSTFKPVFSNQYIIQYKVFYPNHLVKLFFLRYSLILDFYETFRKKPLELTRSFPFLLLVRLTKKLETIGANEFDV